MALSTAIALGRLIKTTTAAYFLAAGLGKVIVTGQPVFVLSAASPMGNLLLGKTVGEVVVFNGEEQTVLEVE